MLSKFNHNINERLLDANNLLVLGAAKSSSKSTMTLLQSMNKKMSQIIAKSWIPGGEEIRKVLLSGDSDQINKLFEDNGVAIAEIIGKVNIVVEWNDFVGKLQ